MLSIFPGTGNVLAAKDRAFLLALQHLALRYFLDNQTTTGLVLDRQANHGSRRAHGLCSIAATGMGCLALALASAAPYRLLTRREAAERIAACLRTALHTLPHHHGIIPHFIHSATGEVHGSDARSTVDTAWLVAGTLWAATFLRDATLEALADRFYNRIDWRSWSAAAVPGMAPLLRHGQGQDGRLLPCCWNRLNGETAVMYVLACGAEDRNALDPVSWHALQPFYHTVVGHRFNNADLGLFVFQYGFDLLDFSRWISGPVDLWAGARMATCANEEFCHAAADRFATYRRFWGLSAGDGPPDLPTADHAYRAYAPGGPIDGTAHLTTTLASVAHNPEGVLRNLCEALRERTLMGRYGLSNVNLDRCWRSREMVGIDVGAAVLALDNVLLANRVRNVFHDLPCVRQALSRLAFSARAPFPACLRLAS